MAIHFRRESVVALILPIFWFCVLPSECLAQLPRVEAINGTNDPARPPVLVLEEQTRLSACDFDESYRNPFVRFFTEGEWYFSWGYSREFWAHANIHVSQPSQGNNFTVYNVRATDDASFGSMFSAQYNIRVGRFIDDARTLAIEFNFDHTKYTSVIGQTARIDGTLAGKPANGNYLLTDSFFSYNLHNGANHIMINLAKRVPLIGEINEPLSVAGFLKGGFGIMAPHPENTITGQYDDVGLKKLNNVLGIHRGWWQLDGWTTGIEAGFRVNLTRNVYLELTDKIAFARLEGVTVYQGSASHNLWMNEVILSLGLTFGGGR